MALLIQKDTVTERQESGILSCRHCAGFSGHRVVERLGPDQKKGLVQVYPWKLGKVTPLVTRSEWLENLSFFLCIGWL